MSLLWVLGARGGSSALHWRGPGGGQGLRYTWLREEGPTAQVISGTFASSFKGSWELQTKWNEHPSGKKAQVLLLLLFLIVLGFFFSASSICQIPGESERAQTDLLALPRCHRLRSRGPATVEETRSPSSPAAIPSFGMWAEPGLGRNSLLIALVA